MASSSPARDLPELGLIQALYESTRLGVYHGQTGIIQKQWNALARAVEQAKTPDEMEKLWLVQTHLLGICDDNYLSQKQTYFKAGKEWLAKNKTNSAKD